MKIQEFHVSQTEEGTEFNVLIQLRTSTPEVLALVEQFFSGNRAAAATVAARTVPQAAPAARLPPREIPAESLAQPEEEESEEVTPPRADAEPPAAKRRGRPPKARPEPEAPRTAPAPTATALSEPSPAPAEDDAEDDEPAPAAADIPAELVAAATFRDVMVYMLAQHDKPGLSNEDLAAVIVSECGRFRAGCPALERLDPAIGDRVARALTVLRAA